MMDDIKKEQLKKFDILSEEKNNDFVEKNDESRIKLRKCFMKKFLKDSFRRDMFPIQQDYEIDVKKLEIEDDYRVFKLKDINDREESQTLFLMLSSDNIPYIKFAIYLLKTFILESLTKNLNLDIRIEKHEILTELIKLFREYQNDINIKTEIYWILINLSCKNDDITTLIHDEVFYKILENDLADNSIVFDSVIWLSCNLLENSKLFRDYFSNLNIFRKILNSLEKKIDLKQTYTIQCLKLIHVFFKNFQSELLKKLKEEEILSILVILNNFSLHLDEENIRMHYMFIVYYLVSIQNFKIIFYIIRTYSRIILNLFELDYDYNISFNILPIRIIGQIFRGPDEVVDIFVQNYDFMIFLNKIYGKTKNENYILDILWTLSNLTSGNINHINIFLNSDFFSITLDLILSNNNLIKNQSLRIINNIIDPKFLENSFKIIDENLLKKLIDSLDFEASSENKKTCLLILRKIFLIYNLLNEFSQILENPKEMINYSHVFIKNGGVEIMSKIQLDPNREVFDLSQKIIQEFFITEENK